LLFFPDPAELDDLIKLAWRGDYAMKFLSDDRRRDVIRRDAWLENPTSSILRDKAAFEISVISSP
jgi:hypothetical protein